MKKLYHQFKIHIFIFSVFIFTPFSHLNAQPADIWNRDLTAILNDILATHPNPFGKVGEVTWKRHYNQLVEKIPELSESQRMVGLMKLVAMIGDGHSQIQLMKKERGLWYPFRLYEFNNGYHITSAHTSASDLVGAKVISIAGHPIENVVNDARSLMGADNEFDKKERLYVIHNAFLMEGLGYTNENGSITIEAILQNGKKIIRQIDFEKTSDAMFRPGVPIFDWHYRTEFYGLPFGERSEWISAYRGLPADSFEKVSEDRAIRFRHYDAIYTRIGLPKKDAYYLQLNQTDDNQMVKYISDALDEVEKQKPKRFIIDIRNNFGGDGSVINKMMHEFIKRDSDKPWKELYLITGRKTFSAGVMMIDAFLEHTDITLVGEPAGAGINSYGDAISKSYPDLGIDLYVSSLRHQLGQSNDLNPFIPVDVPASLSFSDYALGIDPAIDQILEGVEMRSIPTIIRTEGGKKAREVYLDRKRKYGHLNSYTRPEEFAIRTAVDELEEQERYLEALEGAKLNTEIYPYIWNTWYNLADSQRKAGHPEERFSCYKCVMLLAPNNWNVPSIKELFDREGIDPEPAEGCPVSNNE
jgi:hypothetical protein